MVVLEVDNIGFYVLDATTVHTGLNRVGCRWTMHIFLVSACSLNYICFMIVDVFVHAARLILPKTFVVGIIALGFRHSVSFLTLLLWARGRWFEDVICTNTPFFSASNEDL